MYIHTKHLTKRSLIQQSCNKFSKCYVQFVLMNLNKWLFWRLQLRWLLRNLTINCWNINILYSYVCSLETVQTIFCTLSLILVGWAATALQETEALGKLTHINMNKPNCCTFSLQIKPQLLPGNCCNYECVGIQKCIFFLGLQHKHKNELVKIANDSYIASTC